MSSPKASRILMLVVAASFSSLAGHAQEKSGRENLFTNGSFAEGMQGWNVKADAGNMAEVDNTEMRDGRPSLKVQNTKGGYTHVTQTIVVKPNTRYRLSAYVKTKDVLPVKPQGARGACLVVTGGAASKYIQKTKPWAKLEVDFESGLATEMKLGPSLGVYYDAYVGTAWFADLTLVELGRSRK